MSDFDRNFATARTGYGTDQVTIDAGLRAYMIRVYNYMAAGVALTGLVAWFTFSAAVTDTGAGAHYLDVAGNRAPAMPQAVLMGNRPIAHICNDLHVNVAMRWEAGAGPDLVVVPGAQRAPAVKKPI